MIAFVMIVLAAGAVAAPAAHAAPAQVRIDLTDPLSTDPVRLQVTAVGIDGFASAFTGTVTMSVGRTKVSVPVSSASGQEQVEIPTTALTAGTATVSAALKVGGTTLTRSVRGFVEVPSAVVLSGFGCGVISPSQKRITWQVVSIDGVTEQYPAWVPAADSFPAYVHATRPPMITDTVGRPIKTKGSVVVRRGAKVIGAVALPNATRRLLFSVSWPGRQTPGSYTATVTLTDTLGRVTTATQQLLVVSSSAGLCV